MNKQIHISQVIKSKLTRPDFVFKIVLGTLLLYGILYNLIQSFDYIYDGVEHESPNVLMFFLYAFTSEHVAYYGVLFVFALIVADVV